MPKPRSPRSVVLVGSLALGSPMACGDEVVGRFAATELASTGSPSLTGGDASLGSTAAAEAGDDLSTGPDLPLGPELCNGLDDDGDGLIDEVSPGLSACDDCLLLQGAGQAWWICEEELTWAEAHVRCKSLGATAAIVPDAASQAFLHEQVGVGFHWLGARQEQPGGPWSWVDGTPWGYTNWGTKQPDDIPPGQQCARLTFGIIDDGNWFDGAWDDFFCDNVHPVTCSAPHAAQ